MNPYEPFDKYPDEFVPGDTITVRPLGECRVKDSRAAGNYHNSIGWALTVESPYGETVLSFSLRSLKSLAHERKSRID